MLTAHFKNYHRKIISPLRLFMNDGRSVGILLILCTAVSLTISNSSNGAWYRNIWNVEVASIPFSYLMNSPLHWINNFLMAFFFLLAGMEIKRELVNGELSSFKKAILPFGAAFGGMLVPALIFVSFNMHSAFLHGWGIPTATDIAFSLGIASLFGKRIPVTLRILLMALAIIDDLGAIIVVAFFYGGIIHWLYLGMASLTFMLLLLCNFFKLKFGYIQIFLGLTLWYAMLQSGIEASITGVLFAFAIPCNQLPAIQKVIHQPVNFIILPLFALANTAILFPGNLIQSLQTSIGLGIIVGLVIGKPIGIVLFSRLLVLLKIASLPKNIEWKQILGMGTLAGIGFTMSIFTTMLAFTDSTFRDTAKISILVSVVLSFILSVIYFWSISLKAGRAISFATESPELELGGGVPA